MDTAHQDTAQLVPALEQALDHLPSAAIPTLIGDLERLRTLLAARLIRAACSPRSSAIANDVILYPPVPVYWPDDIVPSIERAIENYQVLTQDSVFA